MRAILATSLAAAVFATVPAHAAWELDASHAKVGFTVKHMMVSNVRGEFDKFTATLNLDDKDITKSTVMVDIDASSIDTGNQKRDDHLRSPDFFDVAKTPRITFKSTKVEKDAKTGGLMVTGDLTMHGVTKPMTLTVEGPSPEMKNPWGQTVIGFSAKGKANRKDFGLTWNKTLEKGGLLVGEDVQIEIEAEFTKK